MLHLRKEVRDQERAQEQCHVGRLHAVRPEVRGVHLGWDDPGQAGVGAEEALVDDQSSDVRALGTPEIGLQVDEVAASDDDEADEESGEHGTGPEPAPEFLHVEDGGDGSEEQTATAHEGHENGVSGVKSNLGHQGRHVVLNCIYSCKLAEENHD